MGEFYAHVTASSFGNYVDQVGYYGGTGDSGWVFKVNGVSPPSEPTRCSSKDGDTVEWYYATFGANGGPPTLALTMTTPGCYAATGRTTPARRRCRPGSSSAPARARSPRRPATSASRPRTGSCGRSRPARCARTACREPVAALVAVVAAALLAGCGGGAGSGKATLWVTRDEGTQVLLVRTVPAGETAMQALARSLKISTRYGGRFVQSMDRRLRLSR